MESKFKSYFENVKYIESLMNLPMKHDYMKYRGNPEMYLNRTRYFLNKINNPDNGFKFIHVTGTSGKGSVSNMLADVLHEAGYKVGLFTSPYTTTSIEKIKVGDKFISPQDFSDIIDEFKPIIDHMYQKYPGRAVAYFEIFLSAALLYFKRQKCDWVVLEVGMGGRYDATNVIKSKEYSVITNIDYDHVELLGKTLTKIAYDKVGIVKKGSKFFSAEPRPHVRKVLKKEAEKVDVKPIFINSKSKLDSNKDLVTAIMKDIGIEDNVIEKGISKSKLQCRFEIMQHKPTIIIDGAHNRGKVQYIIEKLKKLKYNKLHLILGLKHGKNPDHIVSQLAPITDKLYATRFLAYGFYPNFFATSPIEIMELSLKYNRKIMGNIYLDPSVALKTAIKNAKSDDVILVTGSLYLAGELRQHFISEEEILKNRRAFV